MRFLGPLVIHYAAAARPEGGAPAGREGVPAAAPTGDINLTNIVKLIPGDVVAIYLAARGAVTDEQTILGLHWPLFLALACLFVCIVLRILATRNGPTGINWWLVLVTAFAFVIWVHALAPAKPGPIFSDFYGSIAGIVAMLFGLIAPKLVPAVPET
jgi:hypothetical protein